MYRAIDYDSTGAFHANDSLDRMTMNKRRKTKEPRPKVSSHLNVGIAATPITNADTQKTPSHKKAKRPKQ